MTATDEEITDFIDDLVENNCIYCDFFRSDMSQSDCICDIIGNAILEECDFASGGDDTLYIEKWEKAQEKAKEAINKTLTKMENINEDLCNEIRTELETAINGGN